MSSRLDDELSRLVSAGVLRQYQADSIRDAADAELDAALADPGRRWQPAEPSGEPRDAGQAQPKGPPAATHPNALVEVLGYIGGALLLGAVALLTLANWGEMGRAARVSTGTTAAVVLLGVAVLLALVGRRRQLSAALASLGCCVAGFATFVAVEGEAGRVAGVMVALALAAGGLWWLKESSLLVATFGILAVGVLVITSDVLTPDSGSA